MVKRTNLYFYLCLIEAPWYALTERRLLASRFAMLVYDHTSTSASTLHRCFVRRLYQWYNGISPWGPGTTPEF